MPFLPDGAVERGSAVNRRVVLDTILRYDANRKVMLDITFRYVAKRRVAFSAPPAFCCVGMLFVGSAADSISHLGSQIKKLGLAEELQRTFGKRGSEFDIERDRRGRMRKLDRRIFFATIKTVAIVAIVSLSSCALSSCSFVRGMR